MVASHARPQPAAPSHTIVVAELAPLDHQFRSIREGRLLLQLPPPPMRSPHVRGVSSSPARSAGGGYSESMPFVSAASSRV